MVLLSSLLLASPSHAASVRVVGTLVQEASLAAGEVAEGQVVLQNDSDAPVDVFVYASDVAVYGDEAQSADAASVEGSNRDWLRFTPRRVTVSAGGTAQVPYRVEIPRGSEAAGTYGTHLVIEPTSAPVWPPPADPAPTRIDLGTGVSIVTHVGE
jgi:hypothetical protein